MLLIIINAVFVIVGLIMLYQSIKNGYVFAAMWACVSIVLSSWVILKKIKVVDVRTQTASVIETNTHEIGVIDVYGVKDTITVTYPKEAKLSIGIWDHKSCLEWEDKYDRAVLRFGVVDFYYLNKQDETSN